MLAAVDAKLDAANATNASLTQQVATLTKEKEAARRAAPRRSLRQGRRARSGRRRRHAKSATTEQAAEHSRNSSTSTRAPPPPPSANRPPAGQPQALESDKVALRRQVDTTATKATQLRTQVASLKEQVAAKPAYPDYSARVKELEGVLAESDRKLAAAANAKPANPDLSGKVAELENQLAAAKSAPRLTPT